MKKISSALLGVLAFLLVACEGSETYRGNWKATDSSGIKFELIFDAESLTIKDSLGDKVNYFAYSQNSVDIENDVETYGIKLDDGRTYQINFPKRNDESLGLIKDENGVPIYTISRKNYIKYEDVYKLK